MAGSGIAKVLGPALIDVIAILAAETGGGAARVGGGGSVVSGGGAGAGAVSVETSPSPPDWKSGGSTYLLKSTLPPNKRTISR